MVLMAACLRCVVSGGKVVAEGGSDKESRPRVHIALIFAVVGS